MNSIRTLFFAAAATMSLGLVSGAVAGDISDMSQGDRDVFRDEVRAYLLDNPEVLMEAFAVLEQRQASQQVELDSDLVKVNAEALFQDGYSHVAGNPDGDITIVEFLDYRCGYCRKAYTAMQDILASDPNIRLILKEFPVLSEESMLSARFALSAQLLFGEEAYDTVHHALITHRGQITDESLTALGNKLGLDGSAIVAGMSASEIDVILTQNRSLGQRLQITGTPAFVVHDQLERGYLPLAVMEELIEAKRSKL